MQLDVAGEVGRDESSRLVSLFCSLASIPSPTGLEGACAEAVTAELAALGLDVHPDGAGSAVGSDSDNLYCRIAGNVAGQPLFFCAHLDTVPPTEPLRPIVVDGVIRNATPSIIGADNKAAVAVLLEAVRTLVLDDLPHAGVELLFTIGEEQGLLGSRAVDPSTLLASSGFVLDHPGAIGGYVDAAPSRFIVRATMRGRAAHSAISPDDGINAIVPLARAITMFPAATPTVNVNVGLVRGGSVLNIVPEFAELAVDVRAIEHQEGQVVIAQITAALTSTAKSAGCVLEVDVDNRYSAYRLPADSAAVRLAAGAFSRLGLPMTGIETSGGSDANALRALGLDCVNLTHGVAGFHGPDEHVAVSDLVAMKAVVLAIIAEATNARNPGTGGV